MTSRSLALLFVAALMYASAPARGLLGSEHAAFTVTLNVKAGDQIGDIFIVKADVTSEAGVSKVEFSIDDQLKLTLTKAPYEYKWDTVDDDEGQHTLLVSAFDAQGNTAVKRVRL